MVFFPPLLLLTEPPEQLLAQSFHFLPLFHSGLESDVMVPTWLRYDFWGLGFSKEDEKDLVKVDE